MALSRPQHILPAGALARTFSTSTARPATPLYMLAALSHARETQHFTKRSGLGVTNHAPAVEAIKSSEVDPFAPPKPRSSTSPSLRSQSPSPSTSPSPRPSPTGPLHTPRDLGPIEYQARISAASAVLASDPRTLNPASPADALALNRAAFAVLNAIPGSDAVLSVPAREKLYAAQDADRRAGEKEQMVAASRDVRERFGGAVEEMSSPREDGAKDTNTKGEGSAALVALVVGLVGANWYAYEMLKEERKERERLVGRVQRLEAGRREGRRERKARREENVVPPGHMVVSSEVGGGTRTVGPEQGVVDKVKGWIGGLFWAN
ncbi:Hypothetical protein D9617_13g101190 [Elsinoe fawcettii]|nr:Hypothetical protein D9617_13g101190 [Elsinoe fawcettii]